MAFASGDPVLIERSGIALWTFSLLVTVALSGCGATEHESAAHAALNRQAVKVEAKTAESIGLETAVVEPRALKVTRTLPGKIEPDIGKEVDVSSRVAGRVEKIFVSPTESVKAGQLLAVLTSREVSDLEAQAMEVTARLEAAKAQEERERVVYDEQVHSPKGLIDAKTAHQGSLTHLRLAQSQLHRQQVLVKEKIGAEKDLIAAQATYEQAQSNAAQSKATVDREEAFFKNKALLRAPLMKAEAERKHAEKQLHALVSQLKFLGVDTTTLNTNLASGTLAGVIKITAPISGVVSFFDLAAGELIEADRSMLKITDMSSVLISADVPESDIVLAKPGKIIHVIPPGTEHHIPALISIVANHVNPTTRTLPVRARIENPDFTLKPGMFADVQLVEESRKVLAVPKSAIQEVEGNKVVFVKTQTGFEERKIVTSSDGNSYVGVLRGINQGDVVATQGSLMLKTQLGYTQKQAND